MSHMISLVSRVANSLCNWISQVGQPFRLPTRFPAGPAGRMAGCQDWPPTHAKTYVANLQLWTLAVVAAGAGLLLAAPVWAHHAFGAEFDVNKPLKLRGTVTKWEMVNPHSWIHVDVKGPDGKVANWMIEGGSPNSLLRLGFTKNSLPPGTEIIIQGYQAKDGANRGVGANLTFPDGRKLFLGGSAPGADPNRPEGSDKK